MYAHVASYNLVTPHVASFTLMSFDVSRKYLDVISCS